MPTILLKKSDTPGSVPGTANLTNLAGGVEVAVNTADKRVYSMTSASAVIELGTNPSSLTLSGGTANGVLYLNGSKVATSGSALVFDGTNLGVGATLSAWRSTDKAVQIGGQGAIAITSTNRFQFGTNFYTDTGGTNTYIGTGNATRYDQINGEHQWRYAASGTAGNPITFTQAMTLDSSGNLGIGTSSPTFKLDVSGTSNVLQTTSSTTTNNFYQVTSSGTTVLQNDQGAYAFYTGGSEKLRLTTSGNLGIGTSSPAYKLHVSAASGIAAGFDRGDGSSAIIDLRTSGTTRGYLGATTSVPFIVYNSAPTELLRIDSSGNLGLGVTPSAWQSATYAVEVGPSSSLSNIGTTTGVTLGANVYYNSAWKYKLTDEKSTLYTQFNGVHSWSTAGTGTAGNAISFTQAMTLDASGNLLVGTTSSTGISGAAFKKGATTACLLEISGNNGTPATDSLAVGQGADNLGYVYQRANAALIFGTNNTAVGRFTAGGSFLVNTSSDNGYQFKVLNANSTDNTSLAFFGLANGNGTHYFFNATGTGVNTAASAMWIEKNSTSSRSINAAGTINASGADYAEYMEKAGDFTLSKGDVCGIDVNGKLTNVFSDAVSFVVKSTDPSYVGGDKWGAYLKDDPEGFEAARQKVDRIAFAGQVPVNVLGATPGQYIVPANNNGAIKGIAVSNPTFEQYQSAVGKVIAVQDDGRALIIVKVA